METLAKVNTKPRNLSHVDRDRGYRWIDRDPMLSKLCEIITNSGLPAHVISEKTAKIFGTPTAHTTILNWLNGKTKKPQNATMDRVAFALGYTRSDWYKIP